MSIRKGKQKNLKFNSHISKNHLFWAFITKIGYSCNVENPC